MSQFFTTLTPNILILFNFLPSLFANILLFIVILFALMLRELASRLFLSSLAATPPHFSPVLALMRPTTPIEVFLLMELFAAIPTHLDPQIDLAFP